MIYLDNAATSYPKPPMVVRAMAGTLSRLGGNPGRSGHKLSLCGGRVIEHCREILAEELEAPAAEQIVFTSGCTEALNLAIRGSLFRGDEVLCSHAEHNAVMRVLKGLEQQGEITVRVAEPDSRGLLSPEALRQATTPKTALCVLNHASNVTGVVQPVRELTDTLRPLGIPVLVDAAQTAGILPVSLKKLGADMIALPGHKGLLAPHGTGVLALGRGMQPRPLLAGGTGNPFFTTDTGAALRAAELKADAVFKGTTVDGVYDADPHKNPDARLIREISYREAIERGLKVMDISAFTLCMERHVPEIRVFSMNPLSNILRVAEGEALGTVAHE